MDANLIVIENDAAEEVEIKGFNFGQTFKILRDVDRLTGDYKLRVDFVNDQLAAYKTASIATEGKLMQEVMDLKKEILILKAKILELQKVPKL